MRARALIVDDDALEVLVLLRSVTCDVSRRRARELRWVLGR